jgi:hypothetical protein
MEPRINMEHLPKHLCATCKFVSKCRRAKSVHDQLLNVESDALEKWKLDVDVSYMIRECDLYSVNWELLEMLNNGIEIEIIEDWEDDDEEGGGRV